MLGKTLDGKYRIERLLGSGGMGSVYAADDLRTGKRVAIKVLHGHLPGSADLLARFEREARVAGSIETDHIVRCFETGTDPDTGSPYMVLEHLVGEDLQRAIRRLGPLPADTALRVLAQACMGVAKAHEAGIIHRDIKPANIFLAKGEGDTRTVKVLDFGVAKARRDPGDLADSGSAGGLTRTGAMLGSPLYMSPEQARSVKDIDHRADLWSLGVVLYQAVAGRTPYEDIQGLGDLIIALCSDLPPPVQQFAPWVSPEVAEIADRALRIDPRERFQSAAEMLAAVSALLPAGASLHDDMLVALDDATCEHVAPVYSPSAVTMGATPPGARTPGGSRLRARNPSSPDARAITPNDPQRIDPVGSRSAPRPAEPEAVDALAGTLAPPPSGLSPPSSRLGSAPAVATTSPGVVSPTPAAPAPPPPARVPVLAIAVACCIAGGAAVYALTRPASSSASQPPAPSAAPVSPPSPAPSTAVVVSPTPPPVLPEPVTTASASPVPPSASAADAAASAAQAKPPHVHGPAPTTKPTAVPLDLGPASFGGRK